jgi:riboflavin kinase/FMN adenylyltransferase
MIFTFEKHPLSLLKREKAPKLITDNKSKTNLFEELGVDYVNYCPISNDFLQTRPEDFLNILREKFKVEAIVAGFNFRFGHKGSGDSSYLLEYGKEKGIGVKIVDPVFIDGVLVSSTAIRQFIADGEVKNAKRFLGRCFSLEGPVVTGKRRGRTIGFPTANIFVRDEIAVPYKGVYIITIKTEAGKNYAGITNVGSNPTFGSNPVSVETHIIGWDDDLYGKWIKVEFHERIRDERTFSDATSLADQIRSDRQAAVEYFNNIKL